MCTIHLVKTVYCYIQGVVLILLVTLYSSWVDTTVQMLLMIHLTTASGSGVSFFQSQQVCHSSIPVGTTYKYSIGLNLAVLTIGI